jgi:hypothetical protein
VATDSPETVYEMKSPARSLLVSTRDQVDAVEVRFVNANLDPDSVVINQTFVVRGSQGLIPGQKVVMPGNRVRFSVAHEVEGGLREGKYEVRLIGTGAFPIRSGGEGQPPLDGEFVADWPSGNNEAGGDFVFLINVAP